MCIKMEKKPFRFEAMWVGEEACARSVEVSWKYGTPHNNRAEVVDMIKGCSQKLETWNRLKFGIITNYKRQNRN